MLKETVDSNGKKGYEFNGNFFTSKESFWLQITRFGAVFFGGPILIYISLAYKTLPNSVRIVLFLLGILAIWSNGLSYLREMK
jgi:hypothetical protein